MTSYHLLPEVIVNNIMSYGPGVCEKYKKVLNEINNYNTEYLFTRKKYWSPYQNWDKDLVYKFMLIQNRLKLELKLNTKRGIVTIRTIPVIGEN